jgi:phage terminase large subunit-like protein
MVSLFESVDGERMPVYPYYWIPGGDLRGRSHRDKVPYDVWSERGLIDTKSSQTVDYARVAEKIVYFLENFDVAGIGFDRYRMKYLRAELVKLGYEWSKEENFLIEIGQGFRDQSRSVEVLEELLLNNRLAHGGHPILKWNAGNAVIVRDPTNARKFDKVKSYGRIDGVVALALAAHVRDALGIESSGGAIYSDPQVSVIM